MGFPLAGVVVMSGAGGLSALMYAGYYGGSRLGGENPQRVILFLQRHFNVINEHLGGAWPHQIRCIDDSGRCRLRVQYLWDPKTAGWYYNPLPECGQ